MRKDVPTSLRKDALTSVLAIVVLTILTGVLYPLLLTGVGQGLFPHAAGGSQIRAHGRLVGSSLIGQKYVIPVIGANGKPERVKGEVLTKPDPRYFQGRPSATAPPYDAAASTFSNLGPNDKLTSEGDAQRLGEYLALNEPYDRGLTRAQVPVDAINTSASGLDPEISVANADIQAHRVAAVRRLPLTTVMRLVSAHTKGRILGFLGEPGVNVLELNLALDRLSGAH